MPDKVLVVISTNESTQEKINEELKKLGRGWRVVSATTTMTPWGTWGEEEVTPPAVRMGIIPGRCKHLYLVTTVVVRKL